MTQGNGEQHSVRTNDVALREIAQRNVEWHRVHTISIALREVAQRGVEWYSVHANGVALREMALLCVEWCRVPVKLTGLIKTIPKFLNAIGYPQPDLNINRTVCASCQ